MCRFLEFVWAPKTSDNNLCWLGLHAVQDCGTRVCLVVWYTLLGPRCASCALSYARVCVCVCVCVRACVRMCVRVSARARVASLCVSVPVAPTPRPRSLFFLFLSFFFVCFLFAQGPREGYVHTVSTSVDRCSIKLFLNLSVCCTSSDCC